MNAERPSRYRQQINRLRVDAHQAVRRYVEKHEKALRLLDQDEFYDILVIYLDALFECGEYAVFLSRVDEGIAMTVDRPVYGRREEELFHHLLYRKAAACFHSGAEQQCVHILRELLRLNPGHSLAARFLTRCETRTRPSSRQSIRALSIGLFLVTVLVLALETLWVRPFWPEVISSVVRCRNGLFLAGWMVLLGGEGWLFARSWYRVSQFISGLPKKQPLAKRMTNTWL